MDDRPTSIDSDSALAKRLIQVLRDDYAAHLQEDDSLTDDERAGRLAHFDRRRIEIAIRMSEVDARPGYVIGYDGAELMGVRR